MYNFTQNLLDSLRAAPDTLTSLLAGVTQEQAQEARGGDEGWSVVEVLCHLRDAEEIGTRRAARMRDQDNPDILPYDQEKLAVERNYAAQDMRTALADFIAFRREHIAVLESLTPEGWERPGNHLELGAITIFAHTLHMACHDGIHCAQIARQLAPG